MAGLITRLTTASTRFLIFKVMTTKASVMIKQSSIGFSLCCDNLACWIPHDVHGFSSSQTAISQRKLSSSPHIIPFKLSDIGEGIREVTIKEWFVKVGDKVSQFDNVCEVQSDKASVTITSRYDGIVAKLHYGIDDIALVGHPLVDLEVFDNSTVKSSRASSPIPISAAKWDASQECLQENVGDCNKVLATPAVRRVAFEHKVDLKNVYGTGRHGRVLKEDVLAYIEDRNKSLSQMKMQQKKADEATMVFSTDSLSGTENEIISKPIRGFARTMVKTMTIAKTIPDFVYSDELNVTKLSNVLEELKQSQTNVKFTFMPFFIKATSNSLLKYPILNSSLDEKCENILYKSNHNIGVAMDTPDGLVVPNIKCVQKLSILEVAKELSRLHKEGLSGSLRPSDLTGGTFTLSNIGSIGGTYTKPVILPPEVAIGGIGSVQVLPRYDEMGNVAQTKVICISWTADHRIIDGATMARFSNMMMYYIHNPLHLMLNL